MYAQGVREIQPWPGYVLPPAFVTGFFGMNTKGLPFGDSDYGTVYAAAFCALAAVLVYLLIRRYRSFA